MRERLGNALANEPRKSRLRPHIMLQAFALDAMPFRSASGGQSEDDPPSLDGFQEARCGFREIIGVCGLSSIQLALDELIAICPQLLCGP